MTREPTSSQEEARDRKVADAIRAGQCLFGMLKPGQSIAHCPLGFPGCGCGDEIMLNPFLADYATAPEQPPVVPE